MKHLKLLLHNMAFSVVVSLLMAVPTYWLGTPEQLGTFPSWAFKMAVLSVCVGAAGDLYAIFRRKP